MRTKPKSSICVLVSGGLDSAVLLAEMARKYHRVFPVYVQEGLQWERAELHWLRRFIRVLPMRNIRPLTLLDVPLDDVYGEHWSLTGKGVPNARTRDAAVYLSGRNLLLLSKTSVFCVIQNITTIAIGPLNHNPFPDATPAFFRRFARLASEALDRDIEVIAPYRRLEKWQLIQRAEHLPLHLTFSCIAPKGRLHCGRCNKCAERKQAFAKAMVTDRTRYAG